MRVVPKNFGCLWRSWKHYKKKEMTFCLTDYDAYGFDLDHTLAKYKLTELCRVGFYQFLD